jgi:hypothetical protein
VRGRVARRLRRGGARSPHSAEAHGDGDDDAHDRAEVPDRVVDVDVGDHERHRGSPLNQRGIHRTRAPRRRDMSEYDRDFREERWSRGVREHGDRVARRPTNAI